MRFNPKKHRSHEKRTTQISRRRHSASVDDPLASFHSVFQSGQHAICPHQGFHPCPSGTDFSSLRSRFGHYRWFIFHRSVLLASIFLRPLAPRPLRRFIATMGALTPAKRFFGSFEHEHRLLSRQVSQIHAPDLLQPFCLQPPDASLSALISFSSQCESFRSESDLTSPFPSRLVDCARPNRVRFRTSRLLRTGCSPPAAPHPASRRRSCSRLQVSKNVNPERISQPLRSYALSGALGAAASGDRSRLATAPTGFPEVPFKAPNPSLRYR